MSSDNNTPPRPPIRATSLKLQLDSAAPSPTAPPSTPNVPPQQSPSSTPPPPPKRASSIVIDGSLPRTKTTVTMGSSRSGPLTGSKSWLLVLERNKTLRAKKGHRRARSRAVIERQQSRLERVMTPLTARRSMSKTNFEAKGNSQPLASPETDSLVPPHTQSKVSYKSIKTDSSDESEDDKAHSTRQEQQKHSNHSRPPFSFEPTFKPEDPLKSDVNLKQLLKHKPKLEELVDPDRPGPVCSLCHHSDVGYLITPCTCPPTKPVHFHCLKQKILHRKSMCCVYCGELYLGVEPLFDHIRTRRILLSTYRLFIVLLALLVLKYLFFVAPDYRDYFHSFFCFFAGISLACGAMYALLWCYKTYYNEHNQKMVDVLIEPDTVCLLV